VHSPPRCSAKIGPRRPCAPFRRPTGQMIVQTVTMQAGSAPSPSVMVVAADADVLTAVERGLRLSGFDTVCAGTSEKAEALLRKAQPAAIVVDIGRPLSRGIEVVTTLRAIDGTIPVCVLTDESALADRFPGLDAGADDFVLKPFGLSDLVRHVNALLQRTPVDLTSSPEAITVGNLAIDTTTRHVFVGGVAANLSRREFDLLTVLAGQASVAVSRAQLLTTVWGNRHFAADTRVVDMFVDTLRHKLDAAGAPGMLRAVAGTGFVLGGDG
jgi:two-component system response regulator PrrA